MSNYKDQLRAFVKDDGYFSKFDCVQPLFSDVLVKIFKFFPKKSESILLISHPITGEMVSPNAVFAFIPIVKVIKTGRSVPEEIQSGKCYTVPFEDVVGEKSNPEFMALINMQIKAGDTNDPEKLKKSEIPKGLKQKIWNIEQAWERYLFFDPSDEESVLSKDFDYFLLPSPKIKCLYELNR